MEILSVIVIIGMLIFVHELGHFLAAKSLKIPVKVFSIGFPLGNLKPLIKFNWNETSCELNWIPLGGFCAFLDDEKNGEFVENDQRLLNNRKIWERFLVISGGVIGNMIFAIFVAIIMFSYLGIPEGRILNDGVTIIEVQSGSPAEKAGLQRFDKIMSVDNIPLTIGQDLNAVMKVLVTGKKDGTKAKVNYYTNEKGPLEKEILVDDEGLGIIASNIVGIVLTDVLKGSIAEKAGLKKFDIITEIDGQNFEMARNPEGILKDNLKKHKDNTPADITIYRNGEYKKFNVAPDFSGKLGIGIEYIRGLKVDKYTDFNKREENLPINSLILAIDKNTLADNSTVMKNLIKSHKGTEKPADITVMRGDKELELNILPTDEGIIGVQIQSTMSEKRREPNSFLEPVTMAGLYIADTTVRLSDAMLKLFTGQLSLKELGGPIMVVAIGSEIAQADFTKLFHFTILISIELVIINILPLPAVDGGHLFLLIIEKIRGRRLKKELEEKIHYTGLLLLMGFGVFLIMKDILTLSHIIG